VGEHSGERGRIREIWSKLLSKLLTRLCARSERYLVRAVFADGFENLIERQILLPLIAVARVVTGPGAIQTQEPREAIGTQFAL